jgi:hypothetical protein
MIVPSVRPYGTTPLPHPGDPPGCGENSRPRNDCVDGRGAARDTPDAIGGTTIMDRAHTRIGVDELLGRGRAQLPVDPLVPELMTRAEHVREIQTVNGLVPGNRTLALAGKNVGTVIPAD